MRKKVLSLFVITICMVSLLTGCADKTTNVYNPSNTDIRLTDITFVNVDVPDNFSYIMDEENALKAQIMYDYGIDLDECYSQPYTSKVIQNYSKLLTDFFSEVYDVDISDEIQKIKTYSALFPNPDMLGFNIPGTYNVVLNQSVINYAPENVKFTWCHEVIHALGLNYFSTGYDGLYETITEAVNFQFFEWHGYDITDASLYERTAKTIGYQLINADPLLVSYSITDDTFLLEDRINSILEDATYPLGKVPEDSSIAFQLNSFLYSIYMEDQNYSISPKFFDYTAQEIAAAYSREFNLDDEALEYHKEHWLVEKFDKLTLIHSDNGYRLK